MPAADLPTDPVDAFISRWEGSGGAERANCAPFLSELCGILGLPTPDPATGGGGDYRFERSVPHRALDGTTTTNRIDLYRRDRFILEAKQASAAPVQLSLLATEAERRTNVRQSPGWARRMLAAKGQAEGYARDLPAEEGYPPFLIVCDVGFCLDLYADFSGTGKHYAHFPDRAGYRLYLADLRDAAKRDLLRAIWNDPAGLDPSRRRVAVTRAISAELARLVRELEGPRDRPRHAPQVVASFLMRCIFCMFAQSVELLPRDSFTKLLMDCRADLAGFAPLLKELWRAMNVGDYSTSLHASVPRFNGGLFAPGPLGPPEPLNVDRDMLDALIRAAEKNWSEVEPAIFGTLLENALDDPERAALGAHFTPRSFVERLVLPTVMEPLREEWDAAKAAATDAENAGDRAKAAAAIRAFHARLCTVRVLDPACGSGNFLYVTLELMKRLEGEVLAALADFAPGDQSGLDLAGATVSPQQFLGLDKNARAVPLAELVLWIGHLQWHYRTHGRAPPAEPILGDFKNIRHEDALLRFTGEEKMRDAKGAAVTRWGGRTVLHPITGENIPDPADRVLSMRPVDPKPAEWPAADFIVGNPPFIAGKDFRKELGDGYAEALWAAYPKVPRATDICLHFWWKAAQALAAGKAGPGARRFGFITTNSLDQVFARRVLAAAMTARRPLRLAFAIPDHPWSGEAGAAAVRIAMTVAEPAAPGQKPGRLLLVTAEAATDTDAPLVTLAETPGTINANLTIGADAASARAMRANERLCSPGVKLHGAGFIVTPHQAAGLGLGKVPGLERHIRPYLNGRDLTGRSRGAMVIDLFGLSEEQVRRDFPAVYQHVALRVKAERESKAIAGPDAAQYARLWWLHGKPRPELRTALRGLSRYIATVETAKHRIFTFLPIEVIPDNKLICIGTDSTFHFGVLSSRMHVDWAIAAGGWLGVGNDPVYIKTRCFDPFPFPACTPQMAADIGSIAEELDALRKARIAAHPHLTLTGLYNVLEAARAGRPLAPAERDVHDAGAVTILRHLHDRLDAAVAAAYGWPADLSAPDIVARVVALNAARAAEEAEGTVRWLRPDFQAPDEVRRRAPHPTLDVDEGAAQAPAWPKQPAAQFLSLRAALAAGPATPADLARRFQGAPRRARLSAMLQTLVALGQARALDGIRFGA